MDTSTDSLFTPHSKRCCNPLGEDGHVGKSLRKISKKILQSYPNLHPSSKICDTCRKKFYESLKGPSLDSEIDMELDESVDELPIEVGNEDEEIMQVDDSFEEVLPKSREEQLEELLNGLKDKFHNLPNNDPLRKSILTVAPDCWTIRKIMDEFNCSFRMAKESKDLKNSAGVLCTPPLKIGKKLNEDTILKVIDFYENDSNSRVMPHKKDVKRIKINGKYVSKDKHLLLYDVKVLHTMFKERFPEHAIGLSKFAELRPKWCVLAGSSGTHSVCVCTVHQNVKLMLDALNIEYLSRNSEIKISDYKDCIKFVQCRNANINCNLLKCIKCPDTEKLATFILNLLEQNNMEQVIFSTWQSTDRCTLKQECLPTDEFVEQLCDRIKVLITHNFLAKEQTKFISDLKVNFKHNEVIVHCDFAENYAYVAQNAAQAFHYNNDQCSVCTVSFDYYSSGELKHQSMILLSDCTTHDATSVYLMQQKIIPEIKKKCPKVEKIYYISDGAKQHFKNRSQMIHLVNHKTDFGIDAEWHCHASYHGKSSCDGLGACLKSEATRHSLQVKEKDAILDSKTLFNWAKKNFENIQFLYYSKEDHLKLSKMLNKKFSSPPAVSNIQSSHAFIPFKNKLKVKRFSNAEVIDVTVDY